MYNKLTLELSESRTTWLSGYFHNGTQNSMLRRPFLKLKPCLSMHALTNKDYLSKDQLSICHPELSSVPFYPLNKCLFSSYHSGQHWSGWRWQAGQCFPGSPGPFCERAVRADGATSVAAQYYKHRMRKWRSYLTSWNTSYAFTREGQHPLFWCLSDQ